MRNTVAEIQRLLRLGLGPVNVCVLQGRSVYMIQVQSVFGVEYLGDCVALRDTMQNRSYFVQEHEIYLVRISGMKIGWMWRCRLTDEWCDAMSKGDDIVSQFLRRTRGTGRPDCGEPLPANLVALPGGRVRTMRRRPRLEVIAGGKS